MQALTVFLAFCYSTALCSKDIPLFKSHPDACNGPITYQIDSVPKNFIPFVETPVSTQDECADICFKDKKCFAAHYDGKKRLCATSVRKLDVTCVNPDPKLIDEDQLNETLPEDMLIFCYRCHVNPKDGLVPRTTTSSQIYEGIAINETLRHELSRNFILKDFNIVDNDPISLKMRNLSGSNFWKLFAGPDETPNFISASTSELPITTTLLPGVPTRLNNFWANQVFGHVDTETDTVLSSTTKENPNSLSIEGTNDITNTPTPIEISTSTLETTSTTTTIFETMPSFTDKQELKGTKSTKNMPLRFSLTNINDIPNRGRANAFQDVIPTKESDQGITDDACSEDAKKPCNKGIGRNCKMEVDKNGCSVCNCPSKSPAKGCLGPQENSLLTISRLLRKVQLCEDGREAQQVTRFYRRANWRRNKDDCVATLQPYCSFNSDVSTSRMPRTRDECYYLCFNDSELATHNYLSQRR